MAVVSFESFEVAFNSLILSLLTTATFYQLNVALFGRNLGRKAGSEEDRSLGRLGTDERGQWQETRLS